MKFIQLSYNINESTPSYGDRHKVSIEPFEQIKNGSTANSYMVNFYNHIGTHIDSPNHFFDSGKKIIDYDVNELFFDRPQIIDVNLSEKNEISLETIVEECDNEADIILFRTFFSKYRNSEKYINHYPVFKSHFVNYLIKECPRLKAVGFDTISLTSPLDKQEGKKAHQLFLGGSSPILIIEDMFLEFYNSNIKKILVSPFNFEKVDSAPCNVYGII